jgi:hypothetical protein
VVGWFAQIVQQPDKKLGISLVIRGRQGTGKTKVGQVFGSLLGPHYVSVSGPRYITGRLHWHMTQCLLLHADAFPPLAGCREVFAKLMQQDFEWGGPEEWREVPPPDVEAGGPM